MHAQLKLALFGGVVCCLGCPSPVQTPPDAATPDAATPKAPADRPFAIGITQKAGNVPQTASPVQ